MDASNRKGRNWMIIFWVIIGMLTVFYFLAGA